MRDLSVADYFVEFLIANKVTDVFGYQGGMIAYIFDSLGKYRAQINYHSCGSEQGAAIAACAYAQSSGKLGVAISTSGPGFTNLLTGMANAWFDSIPVMFVSGNVNTKDKKRSSGFRQNGFQEIQASEMANPITKKSVEIELGMDFIEIFDDAIKSAMSDRMGPVYLDLPINICREHVQFHTIKPYTREDSSHIRISNILDDLLNSEKPVIIAGAGIKEARVKNEFRKLVDLLQIPVLTTMPGIDLLPTNHKLMMGYIGGTARRDAGIALQNADIVLTVGTRLCSKQVGHNMNIFAPKAKKIFRIDIDTTEFERHLKDVEVDVTANLRTFISDCLQYVKDNNLKYDKSNWSTACYEMHHLLESVDVTYANDLVKKITHQLPEKANLVFDVGKNLNYCAQSSVIKEGTETFMSAGLGTMGYAIPASVGLAYASSKPIYVITGDGGAQMNIQELNIISKNNLPIKIFVLNNKALGNIRIFQENFLNSRFVATSEKEGDYYSCNFSDIAKAYGIKSIRLDNVNDLKNYQDILKNNKPVLFEIVYDDCPALPGIVAGGDYLKEGTGISSDKINQIKKLME